MQAGFPIFFFPPSASIVALSCVACGCLMEDHRCVLLALLGSNLHRVLDSGCEREEMRRGADRL